MHRTVLTTLLRIQIHKSAFVLYINNNRVGHYRHYPCVYDL